MALLHLILSSIIVIEVVVAKQCDFGDYELDDFDIDQFNGKWYSLYEPQDLVSHYSHFKNDYQISDDKRNNGIIKSKALRDGKEVEYSGTVKVNRDGTIQYTTKDLKGFSGQYKVLDTDYDCYAIVRGCTKNGPVKTLTWVQYRSTQPNPECDKAGQDAMEAVGLDITKYVRETYN